MFYYIEINVICAVFLLIILIQMRQNKGNSADQSILKSMIWVSVLFCCADLFAGALRGKAFSGSRVIIELSNMIYYEALVVISYLWSVYVAARLAPGRVRSVRRIVLELIPGLLFSLTVVMNPWTRFIFSIDLNGLYHRGPGIYLHWVVVWGYFLVPTAFILKRYLSEKRRDKRRDISPMLYFAVAPAIASIIQMFWYGVTTTQAGITVSIFLIYLALQNEQVLTDALTGTNNRRSFDRYVSDIIRTASDNIYLLMMIDIDNFKNVNDKYGHMIGDLALQHIASAIKNACRVSVSRLYICRFGGDEFVVFGIKVKPDDVERLKASIDYEIENLDGIKNLPVDLTVSIGSAEGKIADEKEFNRLLTQADANMYEVKKQKKNDKLFK